MKRGALAVSLVFVPLLAGASADKDRTIQTTKIDAIKLAPGQYDNKLVNIEGWVCSGHHGVSLFNDSRDNAIHLIDPDADGFGSVNKLVVRDTLFAEFWRVALSETSGASSTHRVQLRGLVRVLKSHGKPTQKFRLGGQFPVEVVVLKITKISDINRP